MCGWNRINPFRKSACHISLLKKRKLILTEVETICLNDIIINFKIAEKKETPPNLSFGGGVCLNLLVSFSASREFQAEASMRCHHASRM